MHLNKQLEMRNSELNMEKKNYKENTGKIETISIKLNDDSIFPINNYDKISALKMKLDIDEISLEEFKSIFASEVQKHWNNKTVPTKFPWDMSWEEDLKDEIFDEYYEKIRNEKDKEIEKKVGKIKYITGRENFERSVKEKNLDSLEDGVAICGNRLILSWDSPKGKIYKQISDKFFGYVKKESDEEFVKRRQEAKNRFKNQAELAKEVFYQYIRPYLMGILLSRATKGKSGALIASDDNLTLVKNNVLVSKKITKSKKMA